MGIAGAAEMHSMGTKFRKQQFTTDMGQNLLASVDVHATAVSFHTCVQIV